MLKIGLTGGIGSGKSTVAKIFETLGVPRFDADKAAKKIMNNNNDLKKILIAEFGELVYNNGILDNKYLANIVFNDSFKLEKLNALVHPLVIDTGLAWANHQNAPYIIKEAALLFEAGSTQGLDFIIGVFSPKYLKIKRLQKRDAATIETIEAKINNQINDSIKMKLCDFVIINNEENLLTAQIIDLHKKILLKAEQ